MSDPIIVNSSTVVNGFTLNIERTDATIGGKPSTRIAITINLPDGQLEIVVRQNYKFGKDTPDTEINWPSLGARDIDTTRAFHAALTEALAQAAALAAPQPAAAQPQPPAPSIYGYKVGDGVWHKRLNRNATIVEFRTPDGVATPAEIAQTPERIYACVKDGNGDLLGWALQDLADYPRNAEPPRNAPPPQPPAPDDIALLRAVGFWPDEEPPAPADGGAWLDKLFTKATPPAAARPKLTAAQRTLLTTLADHDIKRGWMQTVWRDNGKVISASTVRKCADSKWLVFSEDEINGRRYQVMRITDAGRAALAEER